MLDLFTERSKIRNSLSYKSIDLTLVEWVQLYKNGLVLFPEELCLQKNAWNLVRRTRYIESLFIGIPQTPITGFEPESGSGFAVIDGAQRLTTIFQFLGVLKSKSGARTKPSKLKFPAIVQDLRGVGVKDLSEADYSNLLSTNLPALQLSFAGDINNLIRLFGCTQDDLY